MAFGHILMLFRPNLSHVQSQFWCQKGTKSEQKSSEVDANGSGGLSPTTASISDVRGANSVLISAKIPHVGSRSGHVFSPISAKSDPKVVPFSPKGLEKNGGTLCIVSGRVRATKKRTRVCPILFFGVFLTLTGANAGLKLRWGPPSTRPMHPHILATILIHNPPL